MNVRPLLFALLSCAVIRFAHLAKADSLVAGSTFGLSLDNNRASQQTFTVNVSSPTAFTFVGATGTITVTQSTLATGQEQIYIDVLADSDLFPGTAGGYSGLGIGFHSAPLDLTSEFDLVSSVLTFRGPGEVLSSDVQNLVGQPNPWNGYFPIQNYYAIVYGTQGQGYNELSLTLNSALAPTPEPSSLILLGTACLGLAGTVRRRLKAPMQIV